MMETAIYTDPSYVFDIPHPKLGSVKLLFTRFKKIPSAPNRIIIVER